MTRVLVKGPETALADVHAAWDEEENLIDTNLAFYDLNHGHSVRSAYSAAARSRLGRRDKCSVRHCILSRCRRGSDRRARLCPIGTTDSFQLIPLDVDLVGWQRAFAPLALFSAVGALSRLNLRGLPGASKLAGGRTEAVSSERPDRITRSRRRSGIHGAIRRSLPGPRCSRQRAGRHGQSIRTTLDRKPAARPRGQRTADRSRR